MNAQVRCPVCTNYCVVPIERIRVGVPPDATFGFDCPCCGAEVIKEASVDKLLMLERAGCPPPINDLDVERFVAALAEFPDGECGCP